MRIAIDMGPLKSGHAVRGVGFYTKNLIEALGKRVEAVDFEKVELSNYDLIHYPYFSISKKTLPAIKPTKQIITIHDLIPLIYPSHYPLGIKGKINFYRQKLLVKKTDIVITDSETSKKDIVRFLGLKPEKIVVVRLAPAAHFKTVKNKKLLEGVRKKYTLPQKFVLYVGDINYNKNIPGLIRAVKKVDIPLVIVGKQALEIEKEDLSHPELSHLKEVLSDLEDSKRIKRLGFVPDEDLVAIYNLATIYCQPSFYEGFGLPILEAFACGTPVAAARTQALVEIGEAGCLFFDPNDSGDMATKISELMGDTILQKQLASTGKVAVKNYSWKKTADNTYKAYEKVFSQ